MVRLRRGGHRLSREWSAAAHRQSKKNSQKFKKGLIFFANSIFSCMFVIMVVLKHAILLTMVATHVAVVADRAAQEVVGSSYCTYAPNTVCYSTGWPACCVMTNVSCTDTQPPCDVDDIEPGYLPLITGTSYCTCGPDMTCYESGWPSCCIVEGETCPDEQPGCTIALLDGSGSNMPAATPPYLTDLAGTPDVMALVTEPPVAMTESAAASTISLITVVCAMIVSFVSFGV